MRPKAANYSHPMHELPDVSYRSRHPSIEVAEEGRKPPCPEDVVTVTCSLVNEAFRCDGVSFSEIQ